MSYILQYKGFVKATVWKHKASLLNFTEHELESECWASLAIAIQRWEGSKGKLDSWIYLAVSGRMSDLRKSPSSRMNFNTDFLRFMKIADNLPTSANKELN
jgi:hypothetical protein